MLGASLILQSPFILDLLGAPRIRAPFPVSRTGNKPSTRHEAHFRAASDRRSGPLSVRP